MRILIGFLMLAGLLGCGHHHQHRHQGEMQHSFADAEKWAKIFDDPERDAWQKPAQVVVWMDVKGGMRVADIGAGTGYFLPHLNQAVGPKGEVLALDIEPNLVAHMKKRIAAEKMASTKAFLTDPDNPRLEPTSVDRILIVDTWHHIENRDQYVKHLKAALKPKGLIYIVDFEPGKTGVGPDDRHRIPATAVIKELEASGLKAEIHDKEDLAYQYIVVGDPSPRF